MDPRHATTLALVGWYDGRAAHASRRGEFRQLAAMVKGSRPRARDRFCSVGGEW